jgi:hypothetical protein
VNRINAISPESEEQNSPGFFDKRPATVEELAAQQGVPSVEDLDELRADFWPESDSLEEFAATIRRWRSEGG